MAREKLTKLAYSVEEAGELLGVGRGTAYQCAKSGDIPTVRLRGRLIVPKAALMRLLETAGTPKPKRDPETALAATTVCE